MATQHHQSKSWVFAMKRKRALNSLCHAYKYTNTHGHSLCSANRLSFSFLEAFRNILWWRLNKTPFSYMLYFDRNFFLSFGSFLFICSFVVLSSVFHSLCLLFSEPFMNKRTRNARIEEKMNIETPKHKKRKWESWKNQRKYTDERERKRRQKRNETNQLNHIHKKWLCSYENYAYHKL